MREIDQGAFFQHKNSLLSCIIHNISHFHKEICLISFGNILVLDYFNIYQKVAKMVPTLSFPILYVSIPITKGRLIYFHSQNTLLAK